MRRMAGACCTLLAAAMALGLAPAAVAQDPKPADPKPADPKPAEPKPAEPKPAEEKPAPETRDDIRQKKPRFDLIDPKQFPFTARPLTALGWPVIVSPTALAYQTILPTVRLGRDNQRGTSIRLDPVLGLDNYEVGAPEIYVDVQTDLGGWSNTIRFQFQDAELRGARSIRSDLLYDSTLFPQGAVVAAVFGLQDVELRILQRLGDWGAWEVWASFGGHYTRASLELDDPLGGRSESNTLEVPQLLAGGKLAWTPARWYSMFAELDGMSGEFRRTRAATLRGAAGIEIRLGGGWGFIIDYRFTYFEAVKRGDNRDELQYLTHGPRIAILAGL